MSDTNANIDNTCGYLLNSSASRSSNMTMTKVDDDKDASMTREQRKEEAKKRKRQLIAESGGVRPRGGPKKPSFQSKTKQSRGSSDEKEREDLPSGRSTSEIKTTTMSGRNNHSDGKSSHRQPRQHHNNTHHHGHQRQQHRFGRVMDAVPCRNRPRYSTLSIAVPGSVLVNCQTKELRTLLVGQIARAATIYHVDEIIVFDDNLGGKTGGVNSSGDGYRGSRSPQGHYHRHRREKQQEGDDQNKTDQNDDTNQDSDNHRYHGHSKSDPHEFMARLLQYLECPQYLRRTFFPMHPDLQFAGLLPPTDAPHHVRANDRSKYREGVVMKKNATQSGHSFVNCGIPNRPVEIDRQLQPGIRCTIRIDDVSAYGRPGTIRGTVVSPSAPREENGTYWGYQTRLAKSINEVFNCPFNDSSGGGDGSNSKYDLKIGTSERGDKSVEGKSFGLPKYRHSLIVFGGVAGIEECVDADESIKLPGSQSRQLFDIWLNTCPFQGSRTIRTEEAVMITLATLSLPLSKSANDKPPEPTVRSHDEPIEFSDEEPSDESSNSSSDNDSDDDGGNVKDEENSSDRR